MGIARSGLCECNCRPEPMGFISVIYKSAFYNEQDAFVDNPMETAGSEMANEKTFLERAFKTFVRLGLKGVTCQRVYPESGDIIPGIYTINPSLTKLTFTPDPYSSRYDNNDQEATVDIQEIETIQVASEDEDEMWSHSIPPIKLLNPPITIVEKKKREPSGDSREHPEAGGWEDDLKSYDSSYVNVDNGNSGWAIEGNGGRKAPLILVVGGSADADRFATCMRILRYYSNPNLGQAQGS